MKYQYLSIKIISFLLLSTALFSCGDDPIHKDINDAEEVIPVYEPNLEYGLNLDSFIVHKNIIKPNEFLSNILLIST